MKPGDLVEWNYGIYSQKGIVIEKSFFGWAIYFPKSRNKNKINHLPEKTLKKIQQLTEEK